MQRDCEDELRVGERFRENGENFCDCDLRERDFREKLWANDCNWSMIEDDDELYSLNHITEWGRLLSVRAGLGHC